MIEGLLRELECNECTKTPKGRMSLIPSPSGKAQCGEVGGKADTAPSLAGRKGIRLNTRGDSAGPSSIALPPDPSRLFLFIFPASIDPSHRGDVIGLISSWLPSDSGSRPSPLVEAKSQAHRGFHRPIQGHRHPSMMQQEGTTAFFPSCMPTILPLSLLLVPVLRLTIIAVMGSLRIFTSKCSRVRRRCLPRPEIAVTWPTCTAPYQALHARSLRARLAGRTRFSVTSQSSRALLG